MVSFESLYVGQWQPRQWHSALGHTSIGPKELYHVFEPTSNQRNNNNNKDPHFLLLHFLLLHFLLLHHHHCTGQCPPIFFPSFQTSTPRYPPPLHPEYFWCCTCQPHRTRTKGRRRFGPQRESDVRDLHPRRSIFNECGDGRPNALLGRTAARNQCLDALHGVHQPLPHEVLDVGAATVHFQFKKFHGRPPDWKTRWKRWKHWHV